MAFKTDIESVSGLADDAQNGETAEFDPMRRKLDVSRT
jgi:hypothetical protein